MRIAIPVWEDKVSPVLDTALKLLVVEVNDQREESRFVYHIDENDLSYKCHRIKRLGLDILICGAVSHAFLQMLLASGLDVIQEISGPAEEVLRAYLQGNIFQPRYLMPGCKRGLHRCGRGAARMEHGVKSKEFKN